MKFTTRQYAQALFSAISEVSTADHDKIINNFAAILQKNGDLGLVDRIEEEFRAIDRESKGIKLAEVTTAHTLTEEEEKRLVQKLNDYVKGEVEIKKRLDEGLIGGVMVKIGDELIDGSVKRQLQDLKDDLSK
ncbi:MAG: ATP synthase F1 subunit delta [Candidatus Doudnabacteria bacterium]|nr:ATP synthase F1 subunit delta [Candidatus Doudnabacteria bacterium]